MAQEYTERVRLLNKCSMLSEILNDTLIAWWMCCCKVDVPDCEGNIFEKHAAALVQME